MKSFFDLCVISIFTMLAISSSPIIKYNTKRKRVYHNMGFHSKFRFEAVNVSDYVKVKRSLRHSKTYQNAKS